MIRKTWLTINMSIERIISNTDEQFTLDKESLEPEIKNSKVDINVLMEKVRVEEKKEKKENLVFLSIIASVIIITGAIASF